MVINYDRKKIEISQEIKVYNQWKGSTAAAAW